MYVYQVYLMKNKNTLTGPANSKIMPTYHYVQNQGKLMMQSPANSQKRQFGQHFEIFEVKHVPPNCKFFWKIGFFQIESQI